MDEARDLFNLAESRNMVLHVGHVERFNGAMQELKKIVHEPLLIERPPPGSFRPRASRMTG